jgi:hypothetical protein
LDEKALRQRAMPHIHDVKEQRTRRLDARAGGMVRPRPIFRRAIFAAAANLMIQKIGFVHPASRATVCI